MSRIVTVAAFANRTCNRTFVPSKGGIRHNVKEYTAPDEIGAGANVLLQVLLAKAEPEDRS